MEKEPVHRRVIGRPVRRLFGAAAVLLMLAPVVLAKPGERAAALLPALAAAAAVAVASGRWPTALPSGPRRPWRGLRGHRAPGLRTPGLRTSGPGASELRLPARSTLGTAVGTVAAGSLLLDAVYSGPFRLPGFWAPFEWAALLVLLERSVRGVPGWRAGVVGALAGAAAALLPLRITLGSPTAGWEGSVVAVGLVLPPVAGAVGVGLYLRALDARRERAVAEARREQRLEVARGLHDFVAHEITGIVLEAQAAQFTGQDGPETAALLRRLEEAGLRALDSMDEMVGALRGPDPAASDGRLVGGTRRYGLADLEELVERFSGGPGGDRGGAGPASPRAVVRLAPEAVGLLPPETEATAYAVVLEALTNVRRHAPGTAGVLVEVAVEDAAGGTGPAVAPGRVLAVAVTDGGAGTRKRLRRRAGGGGTGLVGLAERVAAHGGALRAGPFEGNGSPAGAGGRPLAGAPAGAVGWQVSCVFPVREAAR